MRHFVTLVVWLLVCTACKAVEPQKIAVNDVMMSFCTNIEQYHSFYGPHDFVAKTEYDDCTPLKVPHSISVHNGRLTIDEGEDTEAIYKINSCNFSTGKVFKDKGTQEVYTLSCSDKEGDVSTIYIVKVKDGERETSMVYVLSYDEIGLPFAITTMTE